ncbi:MAG: dihydrolipoyl dehydrogenase [Nitrospira sp.]
MNQILSSGAERGAKETLHAEVLVLGSGPGGYTAAFRAADLGKKVFLVERYETLGGVCLNVGCIPSKALLHMAQVINEAEAMVKQGIYFGKPKIDLDQLRSFEQGVVQKLTRGLSTLAKKRGVQVLRGTGRFISAHSLRLENTKDARGISFDQCIIAAGSHSIKLPVFPWEDSRMIDSTDALALMDIPGRLLVVGGGIIGLEMACVFQSLGSRVSVVEMTDQLMPGSDKDLIRPLHRYLSARYETILLNTRVTEIQSLEEGLKASFEGPDAPKDTVYDRILVSVGRAPNGNRLNAEAAGVQVDAKGFIPVDKQQRTNISHIFAIGDIVGQPMLAHKATHEGRVAAEVCAGMNSAFNTRVIPSVAYTDPEVAWVGLTEQEATDRGIATGKGIFPWAASGRALGLGRSEGLTKLLFDPETKQIIGMGAVGVHAGDLVSEATLAIEMGCTAEDISLTIHPHPTLSETVAMAADTFSGTITDLYLPKKGRG